MSLKDTVSKNSPKVLGTDGEPLLRRGERCRACDHALVDHRDYGSTALGEFAVAVRFPCREEGCSCKR